MFDCGQWRDVTSNFLKERHPQFVVCFVTYKSFILRHQHPLYDLVSVALMVIAVIELRLDRSMVRSLQVRSLHTEVRSLHSKVSSLHQISYFAPYISYFAP